MTRAQEAYLSVAKTEDVPRLLTEYGFINFVGPSKDSFLFQEESGRTWILTDFRGKVAPCRMMLPSVWNDQNIAAMGGRPAGHCECHTSWDCGDRAFQTA